MQTKLAFYLKPPIEKRGEKHKDMKRQPAFQRQARSRCSFRLAGGTQLEGIGSCSGHLLPSAASPGKQRPSVRIHGKSEGLGEKKNPPQLGRGHLHYVRLFCKPSKLSCSPGRGYSQCLLSGQARTVPRTELNISIAET